jgi:hypothetical protein
VELEERRNDGNEIPIKVYQIKKEQPSKELNSVYSNEVFRRPRKL